VQRITRQQERIVAQRIQSIVDRGSAFSRAAIGARARKTPRRTAVHHFARCATCPPRRNLCRARVRAASVRSANLVRPCASYVSSRRLHLCHSWGIRQSTGVVGKECRYRQSLLAFLSARSVSREFTPATAIPTIGGRP